MSSGETPSQPPGLEPRHRRGGRGGNRGGNNSGRTADSNGAPQRGRGRGGQRGRGRGNASQTSRLSGEVNAAENGENSEATAPSQQLPNGDGAANITAKLGKANIQGDDAASDTDGEICFICASPVVHWSVAPCNHRTCHICVLRLRALYKSKACAHCRTSADHVMFTDDAEKHYQDYSDEDVFKSDDTLGIKFERQEIFEDTVLLLQFNCPDSSCDVACLGWPDLNRHVKNVHHKVMCDLCTRNKKVFTHEHELFTHNDLRKHQRFGDDNPGAVDQSGFKGHPECGFCRQRFYGDDELYTHCRDKHERCHICDRRNEGRQHQYYVDYNALEVHFRKDHFACPEQDCLDKKFVVFESELDLKAHQLESHPHGLSKDARRDARRVDMSGFDYRQTHQENRREGRGRGRGRDPNAEPLPHSSAQPLRRDELAYQRQMAIQSAQSVAPRSFGGQLTSSGDAFAARPPARANEPNTVTASQPRGAGRGEAFPALSSGNTDGSQRQPARELTPQEQARQLRHNAVMDRATTILKGDDVKMAEFRSKISAYKNGGLNAAELIDSFFILFDTTSAELGKLVKELADIFEIQSKKDALTKAWNDWKAIHEDYPSLPGNSGPSTLGLGQTSGGSRVLKLKSSTAQSSRSAANRQSGWGTAAAPPSVGNNFPSLANANASLNRNIGARPGATPWSSSNSSARPSPQPSRVASSTNINVVRKPPTSNSDAFPALPAAAKPTSTLFMPGSTGAGVRRVNSPAVLTNPWAPSTASSSQGPAEEESTAGKKKGKKNQKQTLFHFG